MCLAGVVLFVKNIFVSSSLFSQGISLGGGIYLPSGIFIIPLIIGIVWTLLKPKSKISKVVAVLGFVLLVVVSIASVHIRVGRIPLLLWVLILSLIFGGAAFVFRAILKSRKK